MSKRVAFAGLLAAAVAATGTNAPGSVMLTGTLPGASGSVTVGSAPSNGKPLGSVGGAFR